MSEATPIYTFNVNGEQRKAIDLQALNNYFENKKSQFNLLDIDFNNVDKSTAVIELSGQAAIMILNELELTVKQSLGLIKEDEQEPTLKVPKEEPAPPPKPEIVEPKVGQPEAHKPVKQEEVKQVKPDKVVQEMQNPIPDDNEEIIL